MELRIVGSEIELANFLKSLGTTTLQVNSPKIISELKVDDAVQISDDKDYVRLKDAMDKFNICRQTLLNYINKGMPYKRDDKCYYVCLSDVENWINKIHKLKKRSIKSKPVKSKTEFATWKTNLTSMCREAGKNEGKMLSLAYKYMTNVYGIVWDQTRKDFYKANGYMPKSTCQMAYWLESTNSSYKDLTKVCLQHILKGEK